MLWSRHPLGRQPSRSPGILKIKTAGNTIYVEDFPGKI